MARKNLIGMCALLGGLAFVGALPSPATNSGPDTPEFERNLLRWNAMSVEERGQVRERYKHWQELSPGERVSVRSNFERFHKLDPQDQRELRSSHDKWIAKADEGRRSALRRRLSKLRELEGERRQRALAVGLMLHEAGSDVQQRMANRPQDRRRALAGLRDMYGELPDQLRERLSKMPPWRRKMVVRHIISERRGRFAQLFHSTLDVPPERFAMRDLLRNLTEDERRQFHQLPPQLKRKLSKMVLRAGKSDEQKVRGLRQMLQRARRNGANRPGDRREQGERRPRDPRRGKGAKGADHRDSERRPRQGTGSKARGAGGSGKGEKRQ